MDIIYLSELARLAYKRDSRILEELFKQNFETYNVKIISSESLKCFVARKDGVTYISFRGSDNLKNWLNNFKIQKGIVAQGSIHIGFLQASKLLFEKLKKEVVKTDRIYLVGHSLGETKQLQ